MHLDDILKVCNFNNPRKVCRLHDLLIYILIDCISVANSPTIQRNVSILEHNRFVLGCNVLLLTRDYIHSTSSYIDKIVLSVALREPELDGNIEHFTLTSNDLREPQVNAPGRRHEKVIAVDTKTRKNDLLNDASSFTLLLI